MFRVKNLHLVSELFQLQGDAFAAEGFLLGPEVDPIQWEICGIDSCGERIWRAVERPNLILYL